MVSNVPSLERNGLSAADNRIPAVWYWELSQSVDVKLGGKTVTLFAVVENLFDKDPPPVPGVGFGSSPVYDLLGRSYRMGLRFTI